MLLPRLAAASIRYGASWPASRRTTKWGYSGFGVVKDWRDADTGTITRGGQRNERMGKSALLATIKTVPGKREEYLKYLKAHAQRCLASEPGTLKFEILVPQEETDTVMLYEVYASAEAFEAH